MIPVNKRPISPAPQEKRGDRKEGWSFSMSDTFSSVLGGQKQAQQENNRSERVDLRVDLKDLLRLTKTESISDEKTCKTLLSIWGQSLCSLPSFKDVPRLAKRTRILRDGVLVLGCDSNDTPKWQRTLQVLTCLAFNLCSPEAYALFKQRILAHDFDPTLDVAECLFEFFKQEEGMGKKDKGDLTLRQGSQLNGVIKAINQDIIFPVYRLIRTAFYEKFPFKDVHLSWSVDVNILSNGKVEVYHTKKQQSHSTKPAEYFGFEWTLKMVLNNDMTSMKAFFSINRDWFAPLPPLEGGKKEEKQSAPSGGPGEMNLSSGNRNSKFSSSFRAAIREFTGTTYPSLMVIDRPLASSNVRSCLPRLAANVSFLVGGRDVYGVQRGLIRSIHPTVVEFLNTKKQGHSPSDPATLLFSFLLILCRLTGDEEAEKVVLSNQWWPDGDESDNQSDSFSSSSNSHENGDDDQEEEDGVGTGASGKIFKNSHVKNSTENFLTFLLDREVKATRKFGDVERWRVERELAGEGEGWEVTGEEKEDTGKKLKLSGDSPSSFSGSFGSSFSSSNSTPNNNKRVDSLLRVCDFDLMWGGASHLRSYLYPLCRYRDVKGSWSVQFIFGEGEGKEEVDLEKIFSVYKSPSRPSNSGSHLRPRTPPPPISRSHSPPPSRSSARPPRAASARPSSPRLFTIRTPSVNSSVPLLPPSSNSSFPSSAIASLGPPVVLLERKERSSSLDESEYFEFVWGQALKFWPSLYSVADAEFFVKDFHFNQTTKADVRQKVRSILGPLQEQGSSYPKEDRGSNDLEAYGFIECLRALRSSLATHDLDVKLPGSDEQMSLQALSLLDAMDEALSGAPVPRVRIHKQTTDKN